MPLWPANFALEIKARFKDFSAEIYIKKIDRGQLTFGQRAKQKYVLKVQRFYKTYCYFGQNRKCRGNISPSTFDGQLLNVFFTCLYVKAIRVAVVA